jgi:predicted GIY-YIG superfamily endonuclease
MNNQGYIYIYKCLIGKCSDICKIGVTGDYKSRLEQHVRTPYFGFMPYCDFSTGKPIATVFKVNDYTNCDSIIKKHFKHLQVSSLEIYNVEYDIKACLKYWGSGKAQLSESSRKKSMN